MKRMLILTLALLVTGGFTPIQANETAACFASSPSSRRFSIRC